MERSIDEKCPGMEFLGYGTDRRHEMKAEANLDDTRLGVTASGKCRPEVEMVRDEDEAMVRRILHDFAALRMRWAQAGPVRCLSTCVRQPFTVQT